MQPENSKCFKDLQFLQLVLASREVCLADRTNYT